MDINDWRSLVTVLSLVLFLALVAWTWSSRRRSAHEAAARLPFLDTEPVDPAGVAPREETMNTGGRRE